jgi:hypothetical protein
VTVLLLTAEVSVPVWVCVVLTVGSGLFSFVVYHAAYLRGFRAAAGIIEGSQARAQSSQSPLEIRTL